MRQLFESQCFHLFSFAWNVSTSACAECLIPASTDTMQEGRINDQFPKRVDQGHVERREAAYAVKSPSLSQSVPEIFTLQPALASLVANSVRVSAELDRCTTWRPPMSLNGRISPTCTRTVLAGLRPIAMPASNSTLARACPVNRFSYAGSFDLMNSAFSFASSSALSRTTTAAALRNAASRI